MAIERKRGRRRNPSATTSRFDYTAKPQKFYFEVETDGESRPRRKW